MVVHLEHAAAAHAAVVRAHGFGRVALFAKAEGVAGPAAAVRVRVARERCQHGGVELERRKARAAE
jgi:hypothetical protein